MADVGPDTQSALASWSKLSERLYAKGVDIFDNAEVELSQNGQRDPKVIALILLARTLSNLDAAVLLVEKGFDVEARTVTRCAYENLFYVAALAKKGPEFVRELELDDVTTRKRRLKGLIDWSAAREAKLDGQDMLEQFRQTLVDKHGVTAEIRMTNTAAAGGVADSLLAYRELSTDAAHPSAESLSRHVMLNEDAELAPFTLVSKPTRDAIEAASTMELLCTATLGVIVAANSIVGGVSVGERLSVLADDIRSLSAKFARQG